MLRNNLIVAWRNLRRYRMYTAINVCGLAAAFAVAIFVGLYVHRALTWDRFHAKGDQIYQVCMTHPAWKGKAFTSTPGGLGAEMVATLPAVLRSVRTEDESGLLSYGEQEIEAKGRFADPGFFDLFSFPLIAGDPGTVLDGPNSIVLSKRLAQRLFGSDDPMGQTLLLGGRGISGYFIVTGIAENVPHESSLKFDWVIPYVHRETQIAWAGDFRAGPGETYLQIADAAGVESALAFDLDRYEEDEELVIVPLFDKRLHPQLSAGRAMKRALYRNGFVACLVLLLACINYANLAAGMSLTRAHEVGVRKMVGAGRGQLMRQYFAESLLLCFAALALAVLLSEILLPGLNRLLTGSGSLESRLGLQYTPWTVVALAGFGVVMGLVAGAYPALVQSRMQPVEIMQDRLQVRSRASRILVVVQFVASTVFLTTAIVVDRQVDHWESLDQGYDPQLVICIPTFAGYSKREGEGIHESQRFLETFRQEVLPLSGVLAVSGARGFPNRVSDFRFDDRERPEASLMEVDPYFLRTLGLELVEGEDFPPDLLASSRVALVNQQLATTLEGPVVGSYLEGGHRPRIIGVVSDFQHDDPFRFVPELVLSVRPERRIGTMMVRVRPEGVSETLAELREAWERLSPGVPFSYRFLEDHIAERFFYHASIISRLRWVTGFLVLIACLGVFGMASLAVSQRTKEVAVRKVLGASTASVAVLLSSQSTRLVLIAVIVAVPLTYRLSEYLLQSEVDRIELDLLSYSAGGLIALGLTWLVSGDHAVRAALANPVDSLRSE